MTVIRLGAFGWATHTPKSANESRAAKRRPCIVLRKNGAFFIVVFGRSERVHDGECVALEPSSEVGRRLRLTAVTYFEHEPALAPSDFESAGSFALAPDEIANPAFVQDHDLWLEFLGLASPKK